MKKIYFLTILCLVFLIECNAQKKITRKFQTFNAISVNHAINVILEQGSKNEAIIEINDKETDFEDVITEVKNNQLIIEMAQSKSYFGSSNKNGSSVTIYLTFEKINELNLGTSSNLKAKGVFNLEDLKINVSTSAEAIFEAKGKNFDINVSTSADANIKIEGINAIADISSSADLILNINAETLKLGVSSSGNCDASGKVKQQTINVNSSGDFDAFELESENVTIEASSSGGAKIFVKESLTGSASSSGTVKYKGNPSKVIVDSNSSGSFKSTN